MAHPELPPSAAADRLEPRAHAGLATEAELWLVRHAEVDAAWRGKAYGDLDVPLAPEGRERTRELARALAALEPALVLSSPLERAHALGRELAELTGAELLVENGLREIHRGGWQGRTVSELWSSEPEAVRAFYADPWTWDGHGGESDAHLARRAWPPVEAALERARGSRLVVTTHYNVIRVLAASALGIPPARSFGFRIDTGRAALLIDAPGGWILRRANVTAPDAMDGVGA